MSWFDAVIPAEAGIQGLDPRVRGDGSLTRRALLALLACAMLAAAGCGFQLRGQQAFPFETINVPNNTPLGIELQHLREEPGAAHRRLQDVFRDLLAEDGLRRMLHGGDDHRPGVDDRSVKIEENDRKAHGLRS